MGGFSGLHVALSGLRAAQRGLDVTGHNIANANTEGYSRQRVGFVADAGPLVPALHSRWTGAGGGVRSGVTERLRDDFLRLRSLQEHGAEAGLRRTQVTLGRIEAIFAEPDDTGLAAQLADMWAGWDDLANRPDDGAARAQLVERARTLADGLNGARARLDALRGSIAEELGATVAEVNAMAAQVAEANARIGAALQAGLSPNDLLDQRDLLVAGLAERVGATTRAGADGLIDVYVGDTALVRGTRAEALEVEVTGSGPTATHALRWARDGYPADASGVVRGQLDSLGDVIPRYAGGLEDVVSSLVATVNGVHAGAVGLDGSTGRPFFTVDAAGWVHVDPDIVADPSRIAAAATGAGPLDGSAAAALAATTAPDDVYRQVIVALGVEARTTNQRVEIQTAITIQVDQADEAVAGVNLDEEMVAMVSFQHAYSAAARVMTAMDEALATLIERTGIVGR
ncbi:MAG: flagellar hook-associated protein FlgK [Acidimicrobiia bacterium]